MRDVYRHLPAVSEWLAEFEPYAPGYQPRSSKHRVLIQANLPVPKPTEEKEIHVATKKRTTIPKCRSILVIRDFPPIPERFNPFLNDEQKQAMYTQLTQISDEYA
jgi:hypothetical protein